jgi:hypothetical protein
MIVWRGLGFFIPLIFLACAAPCELIFNGTFGGKYYETHLWAIAVAMFISAAGCWIFARYLRKRPERVFIDKATGQEMTFHRNDSFMIIPVRFWPHLLGLAGIVLCVVELFKK